jgi:hypothetical protein
MISLESAIRTCKIDTGYANKVQSDRFLNPANMTCPMWGGVDLAGRPVCKDSFWTKNAGCNSALDRVNVENFLRPQYAEYITLDVAGFDANIYGPDNLNKQQSMARTAAMKNITQNKQFGTGQFGNDFAQVYPGCGAGAYERALNQQMKRENYGANNAYESFSSRSRSGF